MKKPICIYHGNCADGFSAAWVVWKIDGDFLEYHPGVYGQAPPDCVDRHVMLVDFSYSQDVMREIMSVAKSVTVLDHHETAEKALTPLFEEGLAGVFDMTKSGAVIAWEYFHPDKPIPALLLHVQDRDLWQFKLEYTREIQAAVFSYEYTFENWDRLADSFDLFGESNLVEEGAAIERKHHKDIKELLQVVTRKMVIGGYDVSVANLPYTFVSDAAGELAKNSPFAACYWDTPNGRVFGLRSAKTGVNVAEIAESYGGGGHRHAAGFTLPYDRCHEFEIAKS